MGELHVRNRVHECFERYHQAQGLTILVLIAAGLLTHKDREARREKLEELGTLGVCLHFSVPLPGANFSIESGPFMAGHGESLFGNASLEISTLHQLRIQEEQRKKGK